VEWVRVKELRIGWPLLLNPFVLKIFDTLFELVEE